MRIRVGATAPIFPKPDASNTGSRIPVESLEPWTGGTTLNFSSGEVLEGIIFPDLGTWYTATGQDIVIRDCFFDTDFGLTLSQTDGGLMEFVDVRGGMSISSTWDLTLRNLDVRETLDDFFHVTGDVAGGDANGFRQVKNLLIENCYGHDATPLAGVAHTDGLQVRGCDGLVIRNTVLDLGVFVPENNAAIFLEDANSGNENIEIDRCWLNGGGYTFRYFNVGGAFAVTDVEFGSNWEFGVFLTNGASPPTTQSGNHMAFDGSPVILT